MVILLHRARMISRQQRLPIFSCAWLDVARSVVAVLLFTLLFAPAFPAYAIGCSVTELINAINSANASAGNDTITLAVGCTYTLTTPYADINGLPPIADASSAGSLTIEGNSATITRSSAGGTPEFRLIYMNFGANLTLNQVKLTNGRIAEGFGSGIYNEGGTLKLSGATIDANTASGGGGLFNAGGTTVLYQSIVSNNVASNYGGGIANSNATLHVVNSTISGNDAQSAVSVNGGGAIASSGNFSEMTFYNSTVAYNNSYNTARSGIWMDGGSVYYSNSIVANNNGANNCQHTGGAVSFNAYNLDNGTSCGFSGAVGQNTDPMLAALADNWGPTKTHALQPGSPALNAGSNAAALDQNGTPLTNDQRGAGFPRISGGTVDIGAYEMRVCPTFPYTVPAGDVVNLVFAIECANGNGAGTNDVINLTKSTYTLTSFYTGGTGLTPIANASSGGTLTINGNDATITRSSADGTPEFRLFYVNIGGDLTLNRLTLTNGRTTSGGGVFNAYGTLKLTGVTVKNNTATDGAGIYNYFGTTIMRESLIANNTANDDGGGILSTNGWLYVVNSTISNNSALGAGVNAGGGAVANFGTDSVMAFYNSTIAFNTAVAPNVERSGIWLYAGNAYYYNTIVANNNGANNCFRTAGSSVADPYSLDNGTSCSFTGATGQNTDPQLALLADNGGPTRTHALLPGSPAINAGSNANTKDQNGSGLTTDQRGVGFPRINNGTVDIGAYESSVSNSPPTISNITSKTTNEDTPTPAISFTIGDPNTPVGSLTVTGTSNNQTRVPNANIVFGGSGANRTVRVTPAPNQSGSVTITICVSDGSASACDPFALTITAVNDAPTITNIVNQTTNRGAPITIPFTIGDVDNSASTLTLSGTSNNQTRLPNANITFGGSGVNRTVTLTPAPNPIGNVKVTICVGDGVLSDCDDFVLSIVAPDAIFSDGFESGNLSAWSGKVIDGGDLAVIAGAQATGSSYGMRARINDGNDMYVQDDTPNTEPRYRARFYFDPNTVAMANNDRFTLLYGYQGASTPVVQIEMRRSGTAYQLRAGLRDDVANWTYTSYYTISDAPHIVEIDWQAATAAGANDGRLRFWIDQNLKQTLSSIDNDTRHIDTVRLGAVTGIDAGMSGVVYFDAFRSTRTSLIGAEIGGLGMFVAPEGSETPTVEPQADVVLELTPETTPKVTDEPTAEVTPAAEPTSEVTPEATDEPTITPSIEPTAAPTETHTPQPTLLPFSVPVFQTMDDGAPLWSASAGWQLAAAAAYSGLGWQASASGNVETLTFNVPVNLAGTSAPTLTFQSRLVSGALPEVQVSTDGAVWQTVSTVTPSLNWALVSVDLSAYAGQTVRVQFVWTSTATGETWQMDEVTLSDGIAQPPIEPTLPPVQPTFEIEPTGTPGAPNVEPPVYLPTTVPREGGSIPDAPADLPPVG